MKKTTKANTMKKSPKSKAQSLKPKEGAAAVQTPGPGGRQFVDISKLVPDPLQPRQVFDEEKLKGLAESIRPKACAVCQALGDGTCPDHGIRQDILVRQAPADWFVDEVKSGSKAYYKVLDRRRIKGGAYKGEWPKGEFKTREEAEKALPAFEIVDGERRWRAAQLAGLKTVPVSVREIREQARLTTQLVVNQQHENLHALEEAETIAKLVKAGKKPEVVATELGVSRATVFGRLALTRLQGPVREAVLGGEISVSVGGLIAQVPTAELQGAILKEAKADRWGQGPRSFREVQELIERYYLRQLRQAPFELKQAYECAGVKYGPCDTCPKRSGNIPELDSKNPNVCTDVVCWDAKRAAVVQAKVAEAKKAGQRVLSQQETKRLFYGHGACDLLYNANYVDVNTPCSPLGYDHKKSWKNTLGEKCPKPVLAVDPSGELRELMPKAEATQALKAAGIKIKQGNGSSENEQYRAQQKQHKDDERLRQAQNAAVITEIVAKAEQLTYSEPDEFWLALAVAAQSVGYYACEEVIERRGLKAEGGDWEGVMQTLVAGMSKAQRAALVLELLVGQDEEEENRVAKMLGVDATAIEQKVAEGFKAKKKPAATK